MKRNKKKDDRPFRLRHPDFPIYFSVVVLIISIFIFIAQIFVYTAT